MASAPKQRGAGDFWGQGWDVGFQPQLHQEARMARKAVNETELVKKIHELPQEQINVVDEFVDFLRARRTEHSLRNAMTAVSDPVFQRIWDNPEDAAYDKL
jgi:hypothetical protein